MLAANSLVKITDFLYIGDHRAKPNEDKRLFSSIFIFPSICRVQCMTSNHKNVKKKLNTILAKDSKFKIFDEFRWCSIQIWSLKVLKFFLLMIHFKGISIENVRQRTVWRKMENCFSYLSCSDRNVGKLAVFFRYLEKLISHNLITINYHTN